MTPGSVLGHRQKGAFAVAFALMAIVLFGFAGLAVDAGRLFVAKTELQNAADACALAAAAALTGASTSSNGTQVPIAENYGITAGIRNKVGMQQTSVVIRANSDDIAFSTTGASGPFYRSSVARTTETAVTHVRCRTSESGIPPLLIRVINAITPGSIGNQTARAVSVASLAPAPAANCPIPIAVCVKPPPTPCNATGAHPCFASVGYSVGEWMSGLDDSGSGVTGRYGWIDFPDSTPVCTNNTCLGNIIKGSGNCPVTISNTVRAAPGVISSLLPEFNSRFGVVGPGPSSSLGQADFTGRQYYAFDNTPPISHTVGAEAYYKFQSDRVGRYPAFDSNLSGAWHSDSTLNDAGGNRRLVTAPVVCCSGSGAACAGQTPLENTPPGSIAIRDWACMLLINPRTNPNEIIYMEFRGLASNSSSPWPCPQTGFAGGGSGTPGGPKVPALVR